MEFEFCRKQSQNHLKQFKQFHFDTDLENGRRSIKEAREAAPDPFLTTLASGVTQSRDLSDHLFDVFDSDGNGEIDLNEFTVGLLSLVTGSKRDKASPQLRSVPIIPRA